MSIFSSMFGKPVDKVGSNVRQNTELVDTHMTSVHSKIVKYGDFTFEYLYTSPEPISQGGTYGSVIYIKIDSPVHEYVAKLPIDLQVIQSSIDKHQKDFSALPSHLSKEMTRFLYANMGKVFRVVWGRVKVWNDFLLQTRCWIMSAGVFVGIILLVVAYYHFNQSVKSEEFKNKNEIMKFLYYILYIVFPVSLAIGAFYYFPNTSNP